MNGREAYTASSGFTTPWNQLSKDNQKAWEAWARTQTQVEAVGDYHNEFQALIAMGYRLGSNMVLMIKNPPEDWGGPQIPEGQIMPLLLDAAFHQYQMPDYQDPAGFKVSLSFDQLYDCQIPWTSIIQVIFRGPDTVRNQAS